MAPRRAAHTDKPSDEPPEAVYHFTTYDGSPLTKAPFFVEGRRCIMKHVSIAREYITYGIVVSSRSTSFYSLKHIQDYLDNSIVKGTLEAPVDFRAKYFRAAPDKISKQVVRPAVLAAQGVAAVPAGIDTISVDPTKPSDLGPGADRAQCAHEVCDQAAGLVAKHFLSHITADSIQEDYEELCGNNGCKFMLLFMAELAVPDESRLLQLVWRLTASAIFKRLGSRATRVSRSTSCSARCARSTTP